jgi:hypothetical protein
LSDLPLRLRARPLQPLSTVEIVSRVAIRQAALDRPRNIAELVAVIYGFGGAGG